MAIFAKPLTGKHVLGAMLGFFGVVFAVNGVMTWVALSTFSGIETQNAYQVGRDYNETLEAAARQRAMGWQVGFDEVFETRAGGGADARVRVTVRDAAGLPVRGLVGTLTFWRPVAQGVDVEVMLQDAETEGYEAVASLPAGGHWDMQLSLTSAGGDTYYLEKRVWAGGAS